MALGVSPSLTCRPVPADGSPRCRIRHRDPGVLDEASVAHGACADFEAGFGAAPRGRYSSRN